MTLSKRLTAIAELVPDGYDEIWDCCCDHGLLGIYLLKTAHVNNVHFVDVVPELMVKLENKLRGIALNKGQATWQVHCKDVSQLSVDHSKRNLMIIAGVGGDLLISLLTALLQANNTSKQGDIEFIICPVHHCYQVRHECQRLGLGLVAEKIVCDNNRFYEVLHLATHSKQPISATGQQMWCLDNIEHITYLNRLVAHYTRMQQQSQQGYFQQALNAYNKLLN
ncbi:tRNA (adenine(22)-N(1))-methyltransferase TrmK [Pseudoalteromonas mariniglutinosa]|uniref:tRNA (adenine(22)-N(1))-methyltransferase TrmK n=1 Tax=Pseudoalteromonas mariniglutinosa TaxID=206042 RepID=UPI00384ABD75